MKSFILSILSLIFFLNINAQELKFMGVPFGSHVSTFSETLKARGCKFKEGVGNDVVKYEWTGDFWKIKNCDIFLYDYKSKGHITSAVIFKGFIVDGHITFEEYSQTISDLYNDFVNKYGKEKNITQNNSDVRIKWVLTNGEITLGFDSKNATFLSITYQSKKELLLREEENRFKGLGKDDL